MAGNTFGKAFQLTVFGESHGNAIGGVIDGCPAGVEVSELDIQQELDKRRPGQSAYTTPRDEKDRVVIQSGIFEGKTLGTPIGFYIRNKDYKSKDYDHLKNVFRPSHADYTYQQKYGVRDYRGGGRASARETAARVVGGAIAKAVLKKYNIEFFTYVSALGAIKVDTSYQNLDRSLIESNPVRCPDSKSAKAMMKLIEDTALKGDTLGGAVTGVIQGLPAGLGEPVFDKLHADLAKAMLSINAVKGFEYGSGFSACSMTGSEHNDMYYLENDAIRTKTNHSGGIQGGISNGEDVYFNVAFKPIATIMQNQATVDRKGNEVELQGKGRHDVTALPRAVPIVEAMAALVVADHFLRHQQYYGLR